MKTKNNLLSFPTTPNTSTRKPRLTAEQRFKSYVGKKNAAGCALWTGGQFANGYGMFAANGQNLYAHRVALEIASGQPIPEGKYVLHAVECTSRLCCNPDHLRLGTAKENAQDRILCGRSGQGISVTRTRLTPEEKTKIAKYVLEGYSQYKIARELKRSEPVIAYHLKATNQTIAKKLHGRAAAITQAVVELSKAITDLYGTKESKKAA